MKQAELERAIESEVEHWPGVTVKFGRGAKHPTATFSFDAGDGEPPMMLKRPFPGTPGSSFAIHSTLGDIRRAMKQLGAKRDAPEPTKDEDEAPYRKPNEGREQRPDPIEREPAPVKPDMADQLVRAGAATEEQRAAVQAEGSIATYEKRAQVAVLVDEEEDQDPAAALRLIEQLRGCGIELAFEGQVTVSIVILAAVDQIQDGIYFGLPDQVYHAVRRLSGSGLQKLCISPGTFWKGSWLDPERPELDEDATKAQILGKAYHCARLEPERFHEAYVRKITKADFPAKGLLTSDTAVKAALKELGEQQTVTGESTEERCERLVDAGYQGTIMPLELARWERTVAGRIPISGQAFDQITRDMERIRDTGEINEKLSGGAAEVSIFWTDEHGLPMKARLDYLKPTLWSDLKTFDNTRGNQLEQALINAVRYNRLHVQAATYRDATEAIRTGGLQIQGQATDEERALIASIQIATKALTCWFIFQEKGGVPNLLARRFRFTEPVRGGDVETVAMAEESGRASIDRKTLLYTKALWEIERAKRAFVLYAEVYEPGEPWFPIEAEGVFDDIDFNSHWLEARY